MMPPHTQSMASPYAEAIQMPSPDGLPYRSGSNYGYNSKQYYPMHSFSNGYSEDANGVEYSVCPSSYQSVQEPNYMMQYRLNHNATPAKPSTPMYVDGDSATYGYSSGSAAGQALMHRPASNAESGSFSFQNVAAGLSNSLSSNDRLLPVPSRRPLPSSAPRPYRADSMSSAYSKTSQPSTCGASPASPIPEEPGAYNGLEGSPTAPYHASSMTSQMTRANDLYTTSSSESMIQGSDTAARMPGGQHELQYRYQDTTTRRSSGSIPSGMSIGSSPSYLHPSHGQNGSFLMGGELGSGTGSDHGSSECERKPLASLRS